MGVELEVGGRLPLHGHLVKRRRSYELRLVGVALIGRLAHDVVELGGRKLVHVLEEAVEPGAGAGLYDPLEVLAFHRPAAVVQGDPVDRHRLPPADEQDEQDPERGQDDQYERLAHR